MIPTYAQRIREVRQNAGMTQTEFAQAIGTTKNQLSKYELNTQDTPTKIIIAVCERFRVDANWLLGLNDNIQKPVNVYDLIGNKPALVASPVIEEKKRG